MVPIHSEDGISKTDGIYTSNEDVLVNVLLRGLCFALFYAPSHGMIDFAHAGWKGTVQEIAKEMIQNAEGISSDEIHVAIGPSIGSCCYVVDDRVLTAAQEVVSGAVPHQKFLTAVRN